MIIGIDPGFKGAIALHDPKTNWIEIHDMPVFPGPKGRVEINHHELLDILKSSGGRSTVWLEQVAARPGQGVTSMFRFGQGYGAIEMAVAACGHLQRYVTPGKWKKHFGMSGAKGASRSVAAQRFPDAARQFARVKDDGRAEAALVALYGAEASHV